MSASGCLLDLIEEVLADTGRASQRERLLPTLAVVSRARIIWLAKDRSTVLTGQSGRPAVVPTNDRRRQDDRAYQWNPLEIQERPKKLDASQTHEGNVSIV